MHVKRKLGRLLIVGGAGGCVVIGVSSFLAILGETHSAGDPPLWIFYTLALAGTGLAAAAVVLEFRNRGGLASIAVLASVGCLATFWTLAFLFGG
jgi:hypothetical protein